MIATIEELTTRLTSIDAKAERSFPASAGSVGYRTDQMRIMINLGAPLHELRERAVELRGAAFMGSGAGMKWLDNAWDKLINDLPMPLDVAEIAAHLTNDLMEANR